MISKMKQQQRSILLARVHFPGMVLGAVLGGATLFSQPLLAQDTTLPSRTVNVTSTYKPVLQSAAKINFNATLPGVDTRLPVLRYDIPDQSLYFSYLPAGLQPLAMRPDSNGITTNSNYIKAGFGNFTTPYAEAGFSFGTQKSTFSVLASHISSKGNITNQDYSRTDVQIDGRVKTASSILYGKVGFDVDHYGLFGYDHTVYNFSGSETAQNYQTFKASFGVKNANSGEYGFSYDPHIDFSVFRDNRSANEINALVSVPLEKQIGDHFAFKVNVAADLTDYKTDSLSSSTSNNIFYVTPVVAYHSDNFTLNAGINPSWDNNAGGKFNLYPHIDLNLKLTAPLSLIAGWNGYYQKNNYAYLAGINPYIAQPTQQYNTEVRNLYGGIKGSAGAHVTYLAKVSFIKENDLPLFINNFEGDTTSGKSFSTVEEYQLKNLQFHGELAFTAAGHFSLTLATDLNNYYSIKSNAQAWELPPADFSAKLRWQPAKDVTFKADLFTWGQTYYLTQQKTAMKLSSAFDLNGGVEFSISKSVGLWLDCNNILNDRYQRWNQYPVLGFNILGGVVFSFGQKR
jgi:hypothetical protein